MNDQEKTWLQLHFHDERKTSPLRPDELEKMMEPPPTLDDAELLDQITGSMLGMAIGDALGAHVEFRPHEYLVEHPVTELDSGGTWGLAKGQFTDDTSMGLCLAASLIACRDFTPYNQLVRYKWWFRRGYMSSTGDCFDIGSATRESIQEFEGRQKDFAQHHRLPLDQMDSFADADLLKQFDVNCSKDGVAGNGALMRLAAVPLFFHRDPPIAVEFAGQSGRVTHGDQRASDACRYYAALIVAALQGKSKDQLLSDKFCGEHSPWFAEKMLHEDIYQISRGSYKKAGGYDDGIRGGGYVVKALEAALWAFWSTTTFEAGALAAVNLGDDTDTTAAIYGQLAGAFYGRGKLPQRWFELLYAKSFLVNMAEWIAYEGERWSSNRRSEQTVSTKPEGLKRWASVIDKAQSLNLNKVRDYSTCLEWSCKGVTNWIQSLDPEFSAYVDAFQQAGVDGPVLMLKVDDDYLCQLGINDISHRKFILACIEKIRSNISPDFYRQFDETDDFVRLVHKMEAGKKTGSLNNWRIRGDVKRWVKRLPSTMESDGFEFAHHPDQYRRFLQQILSVEYKQRLGETIFSSSNIGSQALSAETLQRLSRFKEETQHRRSDELCIVRGWYGCSHEAMSEITTHGFRRMIRLGPSDKDRGFRLKSSAKAAASDVGVAGCILMCYVILWDPFPTVIKDDSGPNRYRFYSNGKPTITEWAHESISICPWVENDRPAEEISEGFHDEFVTFQAKDILPQVVVYLRPKENNLLRLLSRMTHP